MMSQDTFVLKDPCILVEPQTVVMGGGGRSPSITYFQDVILGLDLLFKILALEFFSILEDRVLSCSPNLTAMPPIRTIGLLLAVASCSLPALLCLVTVKWSCCKACSVPG